LFYRSCCILEGQSQHYSSRHEDPTSNTCDDLESSLLRGINIIWDELCLLNLLLDGVTATLYCQRLIELGSNLHHVLACSVWGIEHVSLEP